MNDHKDSVAKNCLPTVALLWGGVRSLEIQGQVALGPSLLPQGLPGGESRQAVVYLRAGLLLWRVNITR